MSKNKVKSQQGIALMLALSVVVVLLLMTYLLFALSHTSLSLESHTRKIIDQDVTVQNTFKDSVIDASSDFSYDSNLIPAETSENKTLSDGTAYTVDKSNNHTLNLINQSYNSFVVPESGYTATMIDYYVKISIDGYEKNITIRSPSTTKVSQDTSIDRSAISLNIPAINFNNLLSTQLSSGSATLVDTGVGHIGDLTVDNSNYSLTFTATDGAADTLNLPADLDSGSYALSQGWRLEDGSWEVSLGVYDPDTEKGCIIKDSLQNLLSGISGLNCVSLEQDEEVVAEGAKYPNPSGFPICIEGEKYDRGNICHEDGILFIANKNNADGLPFKNSGDWRVYYPSSDWIAPYTQGARYSEGDLVVYDGILFKSDEDGLDKNPFESDKWIVNSVSVYNDNVKYRKGDLVIIDNEFHWLNKKDKWKKIKNLNNGQYKKLNDNFKALVSVGMTVEDLPPPINIVFPYRDGSPSQAQLNCEGEYPPIDTSVYSQCIDGEIYDGGDVCYENNMLFEARWWTKSSPFNSPDRWKLVVPNADWVVPYSYNVAYRSDRVKVIFDKKRFYNDDWAGDEGRTPYNIDGWRVDGVYDWDEGIRYRENDVVVRQGDFYRNQQDGHRNKDPLDINSPWWDEWINLGSTYNGQTVNEVLNACGAFNNTGGDMEGDSNASILSEGPINTTANAAALVSPNGEGFENLFDDNTASKFLSYSQSTPVINLQYSAPVYVDSIKITSANDSTIYPGRDPASIYLYGINSSTSTPEFISTVIFSDFTSNFQEQSVTLERSDKNKYSEYEVQFRNTQPGSTGGGLCRDGCVQLSELVLA